MLVSVAQFFLYLPFQPVSSGQDWVERDILLLISNLLQLGLLFVTLYSPPTSHHRLCKASGRSSELGGLMCLGFRVWE